MIKQKILIATGLYPPEIGGPATYSKLLEKELPDHGYQILVLPFSFVRKFPKVIRHFIYFLKLIQHSRSAETIYALDPISVGLPSALYAKLFRKRFLLRIAGDYAWEQYQAQSEKRKTKNKNEHFITPEKFQDEKFDIITELRRKIQKFVARQAEEIVVPSIFLKRIVMKWNIPEERIHVIYNAFNPPVQTEDKESIRKKLKLNGTIILSAGRMVKWKGFGVLIAVIAQLQKEINNLNLVIVGDGPDKKELEEISRTLNAKVIFTGRLSHEELLEYIYASDLFVLNTGYEGFSHQLLEVMALGVPIVTTDVGGNPELIENQKTGLLVPYNNGNKLKKALKILLTDRNLCESIRENARAKSKEFYVERMVKDLIKLL